MYASISAAQDGDPYTKELAINTLSDLVFDAGEGTPYALRAYAALGDLYSGTGEHEDAAAYYGGVIEQVIPIDAGEREELLGWSEMPLPVKQRRFLFVELAMPGVLDSNLQMGEDAEAMRLASFFWNIHRDEGLELTAFGYESLLQVARVMLNSDGYIGGDVAAGEAKWFETEEEMKAEFRSRRQQTTAVDFALRLATQVTEDAPANTTKNSARSLLAEIAERPGVEISADFAYEAALGKYRTEDYVGAEAAVDELLLRLDTMDAADRALIGAKVYSLLGDILRRSGRDLEAAMAYREAAVNWDDPELNENIAKRYKAQIDAASRAAGTPDVLVALQREAEEVVTRKGPAKGQGQSPSSSTGAVGLTGREALGGGDRVTTKSSSRATRTTSRPTSTSACACSARARAAKRCSVSPPTSKTCARHRSSRRRAPRCSPAARARARRRSSTAVTSTTCRPTASSRPPARPETSSASSTTSPPSRTTTATRRASLRSR